MARALVFTDPCKFIPFAALQFCTVIFYISQKVCSHGQKETSRPSIYYDNNKLWRRIKSMFLYCNYYYES
uniref:Uncharacterized protein n=2 Tax=Arundo donax TaxID=35708 RepID=A0A0A9CX52_ARUDO